MAICYEISSFLAMHYPKVLERVDSPEQIFHRSFSLGAPEEQYNGDNIIFSLSENF